MEQGTKEFLYVQLATMLENNPDSWVELLTEDEFYALSDKEILKYVFVTRDEIYSDRDDIGYIYLPSMDLSGQDLSDITLTGFYNVYYEKDENGEYNVQRLSAINFENTRIHINMATIHPAEENGLRKFQYDFTTCNFKGCTLYGILPDEYQNDEIQYVRDIGKARYEVLGKENLDDTYLERRRAHHLTEEKFKIAQRVYDRLKAGKDLEGVIGINSAEIDLTDFDLSETQSATTLEILEKNYVNRSKDHTANYISIDYTGMGGIPLGEEYKKLFECNRRYEDKVNALISLAKDSSKHEFVKGQAFTLSIPSVGKIYSAIKDKKEYAEFIEEHKEFFEIANRGDLTEVEKLKELGSIDKYLGYVEERFSRDYYTRSERVQILSGMAQNPQKEALDFVKERFSHYHSSYRAEILSRMAQNPNEEAVKIVAKEVFNLSIEDVRSIYSAIKDKKEYAEFIEEHKEFFEIANRKDLTEGEKLKELVSIDKYFEYAEDQYRYYDTRQVGAKTLSVIAQKPQKEALDFVKERFSRDYYTSSEEAQILSGMAQNPQKEALDFVKERFSEYDRWERYTILSGMARNSNEEAVKIVAEEVFNLSIEDVRSIYSAIKDKKEYAEFIEEHKEFFEIVSRKDLTKGEKLKELGSIDKYFEYVEDEYIYCTTSERVQILSGMAQNSNEEAVKKVAKEVFNLSIKYVPSIYSAIKDKKEYAEFIEEHKEFFEIANRKDLTEAEKLIELGSIDKYFEYVKDKYYRHHTSSEEAQILSVIAQKPQKEALDFVKERFSRYYYTSDRVQILSGMAQNPQKEALDFIKEQLSYYENEDRAEIILGLAQNSKEEVIKIVREEVFRLRIKDVQSVYSTIKDKKEYAEFIEEHKEFFEIVNRKDLTEVEKLKELGSIDKYFEYVEDQYRYYARSFGDQILSGIAQNPQKKALDFVKKRFSLDYYTSLERAQILSGMAQNPNEEALDFVKEQFSKYDKLGRCKILSGMAHNTSQEAIDYIKKRLSHYESSYRAEILLGLVQNSNEEAVKIVAKEVPKLRIKYVPSIYSAIKDKKEYAEFIEEHKEFLEIANREDLSECEKLKEIVKIDKYFDYVKGQLLSTNSTDGFEYTSSGKKIILSGMVQSQNEEAIKIVGEEIFRLRIEDVQSVYSAIKDKKEYAKFIDEHKEFFEIVGREDLTEVGKLKALGKTDRYFDFVKKEVTSEDREGRPVYFSLDRLEILSVMAQNPNEGVAYFAKNEQLEIEAAVRSVFPNYNPLQKAKNAVAYIKSEDVISPKMQEWAKSILKDGEVLFGAIKADMPFEDIELLIKNGSSVNYVDSSQSSRRHPIKVDTLSQALMLADEVKREKVVIALIEAGADIKHSEYYDQDYNTNTVMTMKAINNPKLNRILDKNNLSFNRVTGSISAKEINSQASFWKSDVGLSDEEYTSVQRVFPLLKGKSVESELSIKKHVFDKFGDFKTWLTTPETDAGLETKRKQLINLNVEVMYSRLSLLTELNDDKPISKEMFLRSMGMSANEFARRYARDLGVNPNSQTLSLDVSQKILEKYKMPDTKEKVIKSIDEMFGEVERKGEKE